VSEFSREEAAARAGVDLVWLDELMTLEALGPRTGDRFTAGDVRKIGLLRGLVDGGLPLEPIVGMLHRDQFSFDFLDSPAYEMFSALSGVTFQDLAAQTGIPVEVLMVVREATGSAFASPTDLVREDELRVVPLLHAQLANGWTLSAVERSLRTLGESLRRFTTADGENYFRYVISPALERPGSQGANVAVAATSATEQLAGTLDDAVRAILHGQVWNARANNIFGKWEHDLEEAGLYGHVHRPPAICFLDLTGYTRLTDERGDEAAAELADQLGRLVQRSAVQYGGKAVKWLGDGVMFWFREPGPGVLAALDMADGVVQAGLPPAHVGLHAGPVVTQGGDYYGQTVNIASRIADYARSGEVLVSEAVVEAGGQDGVAFTDIGPVDLKGVGGPVHLHAARRA
jgi:adenylate cyclase